MWRKLPKPSPPGALNDACHRQVELEVFIRGLHALQASVPRRLAGGILAVIGLDVVDAVRTRGWICLQLRAEIARFLHIGIDVALESLNGEILMLLRRIAGGLHRSHNDGVERQVKNLANEVA